STPRPRQSARSLASALTDDLEKQKRQRRLQATRTGSTLQERKRHSGQGTRGASRRAAFTPPLYQGRGPKSSPAEGRDRALQDLLAADELGDGHELPGLVGHLDIARPEDHGLGAQRGELGRLGPEGDGRGRLAALSLEEGHHPRRRWGVDAAVRARDPDPRL